MNSNQLELIKKRRESEMSSGERTVAQFLNDKNIRFEREYFIEDFINTNTGYHLFFDFFLIDYKIVIEVDGAHHYMPVKGQSALLYQKQKDNIKNKYCKKNGIKMVRIRYRNDKIKLKTLDQLLDEAIRKSAPVYKPVITRPKNKPVGKRRNKVQMKDMSRLATNIKKKEEELQRRREETRRRYPPDILERLKNQ